MVSVGKSAAVRTPDHIIVFGKSEAANDAVLLLFGYRC
jgi:hypothetical protein